MMTTKLDLNNITDVVIENIQYRDYPDFVDAFISSAVWADSGEDLSDEELDILNSEHSDFVYECVIEQIY